MSVDCDALHRHLQECEIEYIAEHSEGGETIDWLAPYCGTVEQIAAFLWSIGFQIKGYMDGGLYPIEYAGWVETTSSILVYVNQHGVNGLVYKSKV